MGTSGNPAKKAAASRAKKTVSDASAFKKRTQGIVLTLPSGLTIRAKRVELQTFILQGNIPNPLMDVVSEALSKGQKADIPSMVGVDEGRIDLDMVNDMYDMVNKVVAASFIEPKVHPLPGPDEERDDDLLYVDEVDDEDKMFVMQWATGGTDDIATFREEARADMDALAKIQSSELSPQ